MYPDALCHARNPVVTVSPAVTIVGNGVSSPRVGWFSSRGPSPLFPGTLKVFRSSIIYPDRPNLSDCFRNN